jgi:hypothetical protein
MSLPYPHEVETGRLKPRRPESRRPFDVRRALASAIRAEGDGLELFGVRLESWSGGSLQQVVDLYRDMLLRHFEERRSQPDYATWDIFRSSAAAQVQRSGRADADTLRNLLMIIDGL